MKFKSWIHNILSFSNDNKKIWNDVKHLQYKNSRIKKKILVANIASGHNFCKIVETVIAVSLKLRNCEVEFLQCDKVLEACIMCTHYNFKNNQEFLDHGPSKLCNYCWDGSKKDFYDTGIKVNLLGDYITLNQKKKINSFFEKINLKKLNEKFIYQKVSIGEQAMAACYRFLGKPVFESEEDEKIKRRYFASASIMVIAIKNLLKKKKFDVLFFNHGIYVPHGTIVDVAKNLGIRTVCYAKGNKNNTLILSEGETHHKSMKSEKNSSWIDLKLTKAKEKKLFEYINSRKYGKKDWTVYLSNPVKLDKLFVKKIKSKPTITILTNVTWDAQVFYKNNIFKNINEWLIFTLNYFSERSDLNIILRIHPGEITGTVPATQKILDLIKLNLNLIPDHFTIIGPESKISTYDLTHLSNCTILYGTKMGIDITPFGKNVIVCGEAWIKNKGVTIDPKNKVHYFNILKKLPFEKNLEKNKILKAKKYAYHYFFRKLIEVDFIKKIESDNKIHYDYNIKSINQLKPGRHKGLDVICDGIINKNKEFTLFD